MSTDLTHVAREAAQWLDDHEWIQNEWGSDTKGCLHHALRVCDPKPGDGCLVSAVLTAKGFDTNWNDSGDRTEVEVLELLRTVEVTDADLADTFGPNWRGVVSVVRQAATITPEQAKRLVAAGDAAGGAAWDAAWDAAGVAAWDSDRDAAGVAAWAEVVRDLITPEQYATLTGPWVSVMGVITVPKGSQK